MTRARPVGARTAAVAVLAVVAVAALVAPTASAQGDPCDDVFATEGNSSTGPGGRLADAIDDQGDAIGTELDDRRFDARLANATSNRSRAEIIAEEVERVESRLAALDACQRALGTGDGTAAAETPPGPDAVGALERRARSLHRRVNETRAEAAGLPPALREEYGIDRQRLATVEERVLALRERLARTDRSATGDG